MSEFIISSTSSIFACCLTYPIDVIKTRYQTTLHNKNIWQVIRTIHPPIAYYKGLSYNLLTYPIFWGTYFEMDKHAKQYIPTTGQYYVDKTIYALTSSVIASVVANPLFVLKTRYQTNNPNKQIQQIYQNEGIRGFFKGLNATLINNTKLAMQFPLYDYIKRKDNNIIHASIISKFITSTIFYPFDLVRSKQRDNINKLSVTNILKTVIKTEGFRGLFKGVTLYTMTTLPNFVIMMYCIEYFKK